MKYIIKNSLLKTSITSLAFATSMLAVGSAQAKVSAEEAAKLGVSGTELTPMGAIRAGNAEGTIPAWNPDMSIPEGIDPADKISDPYAAEKPLFTITAENVEQYKDKLTAGQVKMFETYPDTFKMPVYPTHRKSGYSSFVYKSAIENATRAELVPSGNGVVNAYGTVPFPMPNNGEEAIWNLGAASAPVYFKEVNESALVYRNGKRLEAGSISELYNPYFNPASSLDEFEKENYPRQMIMIQQTAPARNKGGATLIYTRMNADKTPQSVWSYSPGVRRVRRAPTVAYDNFEGLGKFNTVDSGKGFNGATDRYDWKLLGRKEFYVPYNAHSFDRPLDSFDEMLTKGHVNPEFMRYELHRAWVVEATVKEGERNVFAKRTILLDEDTWIPMVADLYDNRGELWRVVLGNSKRQFDRNSVMLRSYMYHDMVSNEYLVDVLWNRTKKKLGQGSGTKEYSYFKPATLRKLGVR
ncbi:DUF1329 domain-containing protein [Endozoicomonas sp. OPT23]|uniref:DUF1329 domain-containing protein n=1 Tax=Endozoicomonas sp. OPT23 TaxID=2072845 RepID=UPI00129A851F|nr:DUF1329 domain-containing protein [Endozoicomonas sp. OPT23]MRI33835.1 DUF1329 domain-containing protein [Endozoicomonas sp. OPT23]